MSAGNNLEASSERWLGKIQGLLAQDVPAIKKMKIVHKYATLFADACMRCMPDTEGHQ